MKFIIQFSYKFGKRFVILCAGKSVIQSVKKSAVISPCQLFFGYPGNNLINDNIYFGAFGNSYVWRKRQLLEVISHKLVTERINSTNFSLGKERYIFKRSFTRCFCIFLYKRLPYSLI